MKGRRRHLIYPLNCWRHINHTQKSINIYNVMVITIDRNHHRLAYIQRQYPLVLTQFNLLTLNEINKKKKKM